MTTVLEPVSPSPADTIPAVREPAVVLVDPVLSGAPFKDACARSGYAVIGVYTLAPTELREMAPDHQKGDVVSLYGQEDRKSVV